VKAMEIEDIKNAEDGIVDDALDEIFPATKSGRFNSKEENKSAEPSSETPRKWILRMQLDNNLWEKVGMVSREDMIEPELARLRMEKPGKLFEAEEFKVV